MFLSLCIYTIPYCFWIGLGTVPGGIRVVNDEETIGLKTQGDIENQNPSNREHVLYDYMYSKISQDMIPYCLWVSFRVTLRRGFDCEQRRSNRVENLLRYGYLEIQMYQRMSGNRNGSLSTIVGFHKALTRCGHQ